jgi:ABC-type branched-subunit amino acid transport system substrate-binding protein
MLRRAIWIALLSTGGCSPSTGPNSNAAHVGVLLPFTGQYAGFGANAELAVILAAERVNAAGGVNSQQIELVEKDESFSSAATGLAQSGNLLGLIGPQTQSLIDTISPQVEMTGMPELLPGLSAQPAAQNVAPLWFQLSPSPQVLGCALGQRIFDDGNHQVGIIYSNDTYGTLFANAAYARFKKISSESVTLYPNDAFTSTTALLQSVRANNNSAVVLAVSATDAAQLLNAAASIGLNISRWYFGPQLNNPSFLENVLPDLVQGMVGVTDALPPDADAFAAAFTQRWPNDSPLPNSYFYYDAMALLALSIEAAATAQGGPPTLQQVVQQIPLIANPPGQAITWDNLADGLQAVRQGQDINYQGASGALDIDNGAVPAGAALIRFFKIDGGEIMPELYGTCVE